MEVVQSESIRITTGLCVLCGVKYFVDGRFSIKKMATSTLSIDYTCGKSESGSGGIWIA